MKIADISVELIDHSGSDLSVVNAARVSFDKESELIPNLNEEDTHPTGWLKDADVKLIKYLATHKHLSPFNHAFITMRVKAPIFVARQLQKHEYMPWNEVSRRYVDSEPEFYIPQTFHMKAEDKKQGSAGHHPLNNMVGNWVKDNTEACLTEYLDLLQYNVAPEEARMVLPQNTMTEWIWSGTLGAWCKMLNLRLDGHAQLASREVAQKAYVIVKQLFPVSVNALVEVPN